MFQNLEIFKSASALANHAGQRQAIVAENIANVDTPNFKARDMVEFSDAYTAAMPKFEWTTTRSGHIQPSFDMSQTQTAYDNSAGIEPNGNSVSIDHEMLRAVDVQKQHSRAIAIYKSAMNILRTSVKG